MGGGFISAIITPALYGPGGIHRLYPFVFLAITTLATTIIGSTIVARFDPRSKRRPKITRILPERAATYSGQPSPAISTVYNLTLPEENPASELLANN